MSRDIQLLTIFREMLTVVRASESANGGAAEVLASWTDPAALGQVKALAVRGIDLLNGRDDGPPAPPSAVAATSEAPQSSVEIASRQKGAPSITVKVYSASPNSAMAEARWLYDQAVRDYVEAARVTEQEATPS